MAEKYLVLIHEPDWTPPEADDGEWAAMGKLHSEFAAAVIAAGAQIVGGEALQPTAAGTRITPARDGSAAVFTDGPFTETKEVISGFYLLEVEGPEQARELAALCPTNGTLELRPLFDMGPS